MGSQSVSRCDIAGKKTITVRHPGSWVLACGEELAYFNGYRDHPGYDPEPLSESEREMVSTVSKRAQRAA